MESKAYSDQRVGDWLSQSHSFPPISTALDRSGTITAGEIFERIYARSVQSLDDVSFFIDLPRDWWRRESHDDSLRASDMEVVAAILCDGWVYLCWLLAEGRKADAIAYRRLLVAIMKVQEIWQYIPSLSAYHYFQPPSNFDKIVPDFFTFTASPERREKIWKFRKAFERQLWMTSDYKRSIDSWRFLRRIFDEEDGLKASCLKDGLEFITYAAIQNDRAFFEALGRVLSTPRDDGDKLPFHDFRNTVLKKKVKPPSRRAYVRRLWISRGFFLLPKEQFADKPLSMPDGSIKALTQPRHKRDGSGENKDAEGLHRISKPWFEISRYSGK